MSIFTCKEFDGHEQVIFGHDRKTGLKAIVGIHNTNRGPALGGVRMWPYASEEEALVDVLRLSRGMSYKSAVAGLPYGGGKSVIIGDPRRDKTEDLLLSFGRFLDSLKGRYICAEDVGTTVEDMDVLRTVTRFARGQSDGSGNPSPATAFGVYIGIKEAVKHRLGRDSLKGLRIAVQGLGNVGHRLCGFLAKDGADLLVADMDEARVKDAIKAFGATAVSVADIYDAEADVFAPCALGAVINDETLPRLRVPIVAGSANNQLAETRHGAALHDKNILYAPDYVINAGGVVDVAHEGHNYSTQGVLKYVGKIGTVLDEIFSRAEKENLPPYVIADRVAEERLNDPSKGADHIAA